MIKVKCKTLIAIRDYHGFVTGKKLEEVDGYFIFINDHRFFSYQNNNKKWYVVDPEIGISFANAITLTDAKRKMKAYIEKYEDFIKTKEYAKMLFDYRQLNNEDILPGQMSIYDYE